LKKNKKDKKQKHSIKYERNPNGETPDQLRGMNVLAWEGRRVSHTTQNGDERKNNTSKRKKKGIVAQSCRAELELPMEAGDDPKLSRAYRLSSCFNSSL
jgi:hypothetical protein